MGMYGNLTSILCPLQKELEDLVRREHVNIDAQSGSQASNPSTTISPRKSPPPAKEAARTKEKEEH